MFRFNFLLSTCLFFVTPLFATAAELPQNTSQEASPLVFETHLNAWKTASCPTGDPERSVQNLTIKADPVALGPEENVKAALPSNMIFTGGWHLTAEHKAFGGLSGLTVTETGDLLAVSDSGSFVSLGMDNGTPDGSGHFFAMRDTNGTPLSGKTNKDAEGLTYRDGVALVSFERNNRVLAYNLEDCGAGARGVLVSPLPIEFDGEALLPNQGPEALELTADGKLETGYETVFGVQSRILTVLETGGVSDIPKQVATPLEFNLVGLSEHMMLFRAYDSERGNRSILQTRAQKTSPVKTSKDTEATLVKLTILPPLAVDNFEGIAETTTADGTRVIYIISDNNFSKRQRTLLFRFEIKP